MPIAKAASSPVVSRIVDSRHEIHTRSVARRKFVIDHYLAAKLKHTEKLLP